MSPSYPGVTYDLPGLKCTTYRFQFGEVGAVQRANPGEPLNHLNPKYEP